jgi:hypothetical protein
MSTFDRIAVILLHPVAFIRNFVRTIKVMTRKYETTMVTRESDGLVVQMRKPLDPEGIYP